MMRIRHKFLIFCFVGGIAFLIDFITFNIFSFIFGQSFLMPQLARILGILVSMIWNFSINRRITFGATKGKVKKQLPKWLTIYGISSLINLIIFSLIIGVLGSEFWQRNTAFVIGAIISLVLNFFGSLFWTFKNSNN